MATYNIGDNFKLKPSPICANQAASTADTVAKVVTDLNALLTKLKNAGLMEGDS